MSNIFVRFGAGYNQLEKLYANEDYHTRLLDYYKHPFYKTDSIENVESTRRHNIGLVQIMPYDYKKLWPTITFACLYSWIYNFYY